MKSPLRAHYTNMTKVLIDLDILTYRCGFAAQHKYYDIYIIGEEELGAWRSFNYKKEVKEWINGEDDLYEVRKRIEAEPLSFCLQTVKHSINAIIRDTEASEYILFLSGPTNFRNELVDYYKANRKDVPKPIYYKEIREYMIDVWGAKVSKGIEADDCLAKAQWRAWSSGDNSTVIASIDKDLLIVPGKHYNFVTKKKTYVTELEGMRNFYRQLITGDAVDNIPGYYKFTGNKVTKVIRERLEECITVEDMETYVFNLYGDSDKDMPISKIVKYIEEIGNLLWMRRESITRDKDGIITNLWKLGEPYELLEL